jgi:hypothetical protein
LLVDNWDAVSLIEGEVRGEEEVLEGNYNDIFFICKVLAIGYWR